MSRYILATFLGLVALTAQAGPGQAKGLFTADERPEMWCLAQNVYYEARGSNRADRVAVADVVLNRVSHTYYPNTICKVVNQGKRYASGAMIRNRCQFSWYCDGKSDEPTEKDAWNESVLVAHQTINEGRMSGITEGATHYHTVYVDPYWASSLAQIGHIGSHIFYREN